MTELRRLEIKAQHYQRQLEDCDKALTEAGVPGAVRCLERVSRSIKVRWRTNERPRHD